MDFIDIYTTLYKDIQNDIKKELDKNKDNVFIINHVEEDKLNEYINKKKKFDKLISFNFDKFINENLKSYDYNNPQIWEQLKVDLPRTNIFINGRKINSIKEFDKRLKKLSHIVHKSKSIPTLLAMICCQSSYAFPYILLSGIYCDKPDLLLTSESKNRNININYENGLQISLEANFSIKDTAKDKIVNSVYMIMRIDADNKIDNFFSEAGLLQWHVKYI